jgi:hypothetical protein
MHIEILILIIIVFLLTATIIIFNFNPSSLVPLSLRAFLIGLSHLLLLKGCLVTELFDTPLGLGDALVSNCDVGSHNRGVLGEFSDDKLLLNHLDLFVKGL